MVSLARQILSDIGVVPNYVGADLSGHRVANDGKLALHFLNSAAIDQQVTILTGYSRSGLKLVNRVVVVPAGGELVAGPFDVETYNQRDDAGYMHIDYQSVEGLAVAALQMP